MNTPSQIHSWIERGKQIGKRFSFERDGTMFYSTIAIQKKGDRYQVVIDEIDERHLASEDFSREETRIFDRLEEAVLFIESTTSIKVEDLRPSKGQKWF